MSLKQIVILFLLLLLLPGFLGKVSLTQFSDFLKHPSLNGFTNAVGTVFKADIEFYKSLINPLIQKVTDMFKKGSGQ